jgi:hypothetical protein
MSPISQGAPSLRAPVTARASGVGPARLAGPAGAAGRKGAACGCTDLDSYPGRLAPVAPVAALGPELPSLPDAGPLADLQSTYGPRPRAAQGFAPPKGFFLDRYVY